VKVKEPAGLEEELGRKIDLVIGICLFHARAFASTAIGTALAWTKLRENRRKRE
jgi:hypothetical protein